MGALRGWASDSVCKAHPHGMLIAFGGPYKPCNFSASNLDFCYKYSITQSMEVMLQELELTPSSMPLPRGDKEIGKLC